MKINHEITLDLSRQGIQVTIPLTQFDIASHRVVIHLRNGSKPVKIDPRQHAIAVPSVGGLESVYTYAEESAYPNCLVYDVSNTITGTPGIHEATIKVLGLDGSVLGTPKLAFMVREDLTAESMIDTDAGQADFRLFLDATNNINAYLGIKDPLKTNAITLTGAANELHDGKVDKIEISEGWMDNGIHGIYGIDDSGNPVLFPATPEAINDSVAFRDANGRIKTGTPVANSDAVPKVYADEIKSALVGSINKKADKLTNPYGDPSVYAIDGNSDTQRSIRLSSTAIGGSAMLRDGNGRTRVASPVDEEDAANKGFVERTIDSKINEIKLIEIVSSLPSVGKPNKIYLVPKVDSQSNDLYDEFLWNEVTGKWEWVTTKQLEVDLSGHATLPYVNQTFANALNGSASGEVVLLDDVSPVEHDVGVKVFAPHIADLSEIKVLKSGKNFFNPNAIIGGYVSSVGVFSASTSGEKSVIIRCAPNTYYSLSFKSTTRTMRVSAFTDYPASGGQGNLLLNSGEKNSYTFNSQKSNYLAIWFYNNAGETYTLSQVVSGFQIEIGNAPTQYEPYIAPVEYPVNSDGSVDGVRSTYPSMTMMTDTAGAVVECNYNRDLNKAFEKITQAIISLGGNV